MSRIEPVMWVKMANAIEVEHAIEEKVYTAEELAKLKKLHPTTIRKHFVDEPGVMRLGHAAGGRRRRYFTLRIPASVAARVFQRLTNCVGSQGGGT
jgi:hypothetical protein